MKPQASPATTPRGFWRETLAAQRTEAARRLDGSPSLWRGVEDIVAQETEAAAH